MLSVWPVGAARSWLCFPLCLEITYWGGRATGHWDKTVVLIYPVCLKSVWCVEQGGTNRNKKDHGAWLCPLCRYRRALGAPLGKQPQLCKLLSDCGYISLLNPHHPPFNQTGSRGPCQPLALSSLYRAPGADGYFCFQLSPRRCADVRASDIFR